MNIRYGRYKIDNHILTVYSGIFKNVAYIDEELCANKCGLFAKLVVNNYEIPINISCNIFSDIKVIYQNERIHKTDRY